MANFPSSESWEWTIWHVMDNAFWCLKFWSENVERDNLAASEKRKCLSVYVSRLWRRYRGLRAAAPRDGVLSWLRQTALVTSQADSLLKVNNRWDLKPTWGFLCCVSELHFCKCHTLSYCSPQLLKVPLYCLVTVNTEQRKWNMAARYSEERCFTNEIRRQAKRIF